MHALYLKWLARTAAGHEEQNRPNNDQNDSYFHNISFLRYLTYSP